VGGGIPAPERQKAGAVNPVTGLLRHHSGRCYCRTARYDRDSLRLSVPLSNLAVKAHDSRGGPASPPARKAWDRTAGDRNPTQKLLRHTPYGQLTGERLAHVTSRAAIGGGVTRPHRLDRLPLRGVDGFTLAGRTA
jgi:hypothetical protein